VIFYKIQEEFLFAVRFFDLLRLIAQRQ